MLLLLLLRCRALRLLREGPRLPLRWGVLLPRGGLLLLLRGWAS